MKKIFICEITTTESLNIPQIFKKVSEKLGGHFEQSKIIVTAGKEEPDYRPYGYPRDPVAIVYYLQDEIIVTTPLTEEPF